jgi:hypothetical protein
MVWKVEVDRSSIRSCSVAGFSVSGVKPSSANTVLVVYE